MNDTITPPISNTNARNSNMGVGVGQSTVPHAAARLPTVRRRDVFPEPPRNAQGVRTTAYSFIEYFQNRNDGDVYIQNLSDMQISLDIDLGMGQNQSVRVPPLRHVFNLTEEISFELLKKSNNFRKAHSKRHGGSPDFILLDEEQENAYYEALARDRRLVYSDGMPNTDGARDLARKEWIEATTTRVESEHVSPNNPYNFAPPKSAQELIQLELAGRGIGSNGQGWEVNRMQAGMDPGQYGATNGGIITMMEVVNPRVLDLCNQARADLLPGQRISEADLQTRLGQLHHLKDVDYQHIQSQGMYRSVKRWAGEKLARLSAGADLAEEDPSEFQPSMAGQGLVARAERQGAVMAMPQGFGPQGPAALGQQRDTQGMEYTGPTGFVNARFKEAHARTESMASVLVDASGNPL